MIRVYILNTLIWTSSDPSNSLIFSINLFYICCMPCREKISVFLFALAVAILCSCQRSEVHTDLLHHNWEFRQAGTEEWFPSHIPGSFHLDLLNNGFIEDPFFWNNEAQLQWISENDWEYKTVFSGKKFLKRENIEIIFDGLDTYADVYLNDSLLLSADNMFRGWHMTGGEVMVLCRD